MRQSAVHCSQDYGNSEEDCTNPRAYCRGCMEAVYFGTGYGGGGKGPWIGADMEARPPQTAALRRRPRAAHSLLNDWRPGRPPGGRRWASTAGRLSTAPSWSRSS
jgi:hypothetical protein